VSQILPAHDPSPGTRRSGLYVHLPFCHVKCRFCAFAAFPGRLNDIPRYLATLASDLRRLPAVSLDTIYFGGGTPTVLDPADWDGLFGVLRERFTFLSPEISVECNPESTTPELLEAFKRLGVNRLSFGLQAFQDKHLAGLGRLHDAARFERSWRDARAAGFKNLNLDLMYGLPGQTFAEWEESLDRALRLAPEHLSAYALTVEEKTAFGHHGVETDDDLQADMYEALADRFEGAGYVHYEISNFAKPGRECRHNFKYWRNEECLGAGVSAAWYREGVRRKNTENLTAYMEAIEAGRSPVIEETCLPEPDQVGEDLMLGLRTKDGATLSERALDLYGDKLRRHAVDGLILMECGHVRPTRRGWLLSNRLFRDLLSPE
jgi:oxygen-independent coproporphyrinogen III oxidase